MLPVADRVSNLPFGYRARRSTLGDADAYCATVRVIDIECCGETNTTLEECTADLANPRLDNGAGAVAVERPDGTPVAFANCFNELHSNRGLFLDVFIDPRDPAAVVIGDALVSAAVDYAREIAADFPDTEPFIRTGLYANDDAFRAALDAHGFAQSRILWRMRIDHAQPVGATSAPNRFSFRDFDGDEHTWKMLHGLMMDAFIDYHDFRPQPYDDWREYWTQSTAEPAWWRLAFFGDDLVGACLCGRRFETAGFGYIDQIAVLKAHRGNGIGRALLLDAFHRNQQRGLHGTLLHGDSTNPTGAMVLYESVGMRPDREYLAYRRTL